MDSEKTLLGLEVVAEGGEEHVRIGSEFGIETVDFRSFAHCQVGSQGEVDIFRQVVFQAGRKGEGVIGQVVEEHGAEGDQGR